MREAKLNMPDDVFDQFKREAEANGINSAQMYMIMTLSRIARGLAVLAMPGATTAPAINSQGDGSAKPRVAGRPKVAPEPEPSDEDLMHSTAGLRGFISADIKDAAAREVADEMLDTRPLNEVIKIIYGVPGSLAQACQWRYLDAITYPEVVAARDAFVDRVHAGEY